MTPPPRKLHTLPIESNFLALPLPLPLPLQCAAVKGS
jgi:hypothetical protein